VLDWLGCSKSSPLLIKCMVPDGLARGSLPVGQRPRIYVIYLPRRTSSESKCSSVNKLGDPANWGWHLAKQPYFSSWLGRAGSAWAAGVFRAARFCPPPARWAQAGTLVLSTHRLCSLFTDLEGRKPLDEPDRLSYSALPESADAMHLLSVLPLLHLLTVSTCQSQYRSAVVVAGERGHIRQGQFVLNPKIQSTYHQLPRYQAASPNSLWFVRYTHTHAVRAYGELPAGQPVNGENTNFEEWVCGMEVSHINEQLSPRGF
jgi:hypothetical protein